MRPSQHMWCAKARADVVACIGD